MARGRYLPARPRLKLVSMLWTDVEVVRAAAGGASWNWTAIGTVALAAATFAILWYTVVSTRRDRRRGPGRA
jgi:hypothetical protein